MGIAVIKRKTWPLMAAIPMFFSVVRAGGIEPSAYSV